MVGIETGEVHKFSNNKRNHNIASGKWLKNMHENKNVIHIQSNFPCNKIFLM